MGCDLELSCALVFFHSLPLNNRCACGAARILQAAATAASAASTEPLDVKAMVEKVLVDTGYREHRSSKLSIDDFLTLLTAMNAAGIHFAA